MFKIAFVILCASAMLMFGAYAFTQPGSEKEDRSTEPRHRDEDGRPPHGGDGNDVVWIRKVRIELGKLTPNLRARVDALLLRLTASQEALAAADREEDLAKSAVVEARASAASASLELKRATSDMLLAQAEYDAADAASRIQVNDGYFGSLQVEAPHPPSRPNPSTLLRPRLQLQTATERYKITMAQISREVQNAQLRLRNATGRIATARADLAQTEAQILDLAAGN